MTSGITQERLAEMETYLLRFPRMGRKLTEKAMLAVREHSDPESEFERQLGKAEKRLEPARLRAEAAKAAWEATPEYQVYLREQREEDLRRREEDRQRLAANNLLADEHLTVLAWRELQANRAGQRGYHPSELPALVAKLASRQAALPVGHELRGLG